MSRYVLDNAIAMAWCFSDEATPFTENLLDRLANQIDSAVVPALWLYEVTNVSMLAVRKGRSSRPKAAKFLDDVADLPIEVEPSPAGLATVFATIPAFDGTARAYRLRCCLSRACHPQAASARHV